MGWNVTVQRDGSEILQISDQDMSGKAALSAADLDAIRNGGAHLLAFAGDGEVEAEDRVVHVLKTQRDDILMLLRRVLRSPVNETIRSQALGYLERHGLLTGNILR